MTLPRRRFKQTELLQDRLANWAHGVREESNCLPPGPERDELLQKLRSADTAAHLVEDWAKSPDLQPSK